jgi:hypothetical protein
MKKKKFANIILPFSNKSDEDNINNFLRTMAHNDSRIKQSYINKKLGGYIDIFIDEEQKNIDKDNNIELRYEMIYDKIGILRNSEELWQKNLEELKKYIDGNGKKPSIKNKDKNIKYLATWISHQKRNYLYIQQIMMNDNIRKLWFNFINDDKYKQYFVSNEQEWLNNLEIIKKYINENNKRPSSEDKNNNIKYLGNWLLHQQKNYINKEQIITKDNIRKIWEEFINDDKYKKYFLSNEQEWNNNLEKVKKHIDENNKKPTPYDKNKNIKILGKWISMQQVNYSKKQKIMKNKSIYEIWTNFINDNKYKQYFISNEQEWLNNLELVKKYIDENNKRPSIHDINNNTKHSGQWISDQQKKYKKKQYNMANNDIYIQWTNFINDDKYKKYFISNNEEWVNNLESVKKYIDENKKRPSTKNINTYSMGNWILTQQKNFLDKKYIMKNDNICKLWFNFINDSKYKYYFLSNEQEWLNNLEIIKIYINENNKRPSTEDTNNNIKKLGKWISTQQQNYSKQINIMKNIDICNQWMDFINDNKYKNYFIN